jgi:hypothetical protein
MKLERKLDPEKLFKPSCAVISIMTILSTFVPIFSENIIENALIALMAVPTIISLTIMVLVFFAWSLTPSRWWTF